MSRFTPEDQYTCDLCGACCQTYSIFASPEDARREPRIVSECQKLAEHLDDGRFSLRLFPLPFLDACPFLGEDKGCTIYETRPRVCRVIVAGDAQCQEARKHKGHAPLKPDHRGDE